MHGQLISIPQSVDPHRLARRRLRHLTSLGQPLRLVTHQPPVSPPLTLSEETLAKLRRVGGAGLFIHIQNTTFA